MRERWDVKGIKRERQIEGEREIEKSKKGYMDTVSSNNFANEQKMDQSFFIPQATVSTFAI